MKIGPASKERGSTLQWFSYRGSAELHAAIRDKGSLNLNGAKGDRDSRVVACGCECTIGMCSCHPIFVSVQWFRADHDREILESGGSIVTHFRGSHAYLELLRRCCDLHIQGPRVRTVTEHTSVQFVSQFHECCRGRGWFGRNHVHLARLISAERVGDIGWPPIERCLSDDLA